MQNIPVVEGDDLYKYLGIWQSDEIDDTFNCKSIKEKMNQKMEEINSDESSNRRYITRINTEIINIFRYSASVVNWKITDLDKIDLEIRKYLRKAKYIGETPKIDYGIVRNEYGIELKTLIHKIPETKIEEIINEGIEKKKEKEVVEIKKLLTNTSKNGSVIKLMDILEDGLSQKE
ncbi:hypothetical protein, conserved [Entamoeba histolytica]